MSQSVALGPALLGWLAERVVLAGSRLGSWFAGHRSIAMLFCFALACTIVTAQSGSPPVNTATPTSYDFSPDSTVSLISSAVSSSLDGLANNASLRGYGNLLAGFFLVALLTWTSLRTMASGRGLGELIGEWVPIFVSFGIVYLFLDRDAGALIVSTMDGIASAIGGSNMATLEGAIRTGAVPIFKAMAAVVNQPRATEGAQVSGMGGLLGWLATLGASAASIIISAIAKVVTCLVLVLVGVVMVANIVLGFMSIKLVLALAPVMVPFLMFKPLGFLFDGWLRFLLGACMLKVVVAFLLTLVGGLLTAMNNLAQQIYKESWQVSGIETMYVDVLMYGMTMVFAILAALLMHQASGIAQGLISGSAGSIGFQGIKGLSQGASGRIAGSALSSVSTRPAAAAGVAAARGARNAFAYEVGHYQGRNGREPDLRYRPPPAQAAYNRGRRDGGRASGGPTP